MMFQSSLKVRPWHHEVTVISHYEQAVNLLANPSSRFDVIIADNSVPFSPDYEHEMIVSMLLISHIRCRVKGFGIFVPGHYETVFVQRMGHGPVVVADKTCWTVSDQRDWNKMFHIVQNMMGEFMV